MCGQAEDHCVVGKHTGWCGLLNCSEDVVLHNGEITDTLAKEVKTITHNRGARLEYRAMNEVNANLMIARSGML